MKRAFATFLVVSYVLFAPACFAGVLGASHAMNDMPEGHGAHPFFCPSGASDCATQPFTDIADHAGMYSVVSSIGVEAGVFLALLSFALFFFGLLFGGYTEVVQQFFSSDLSRALRARLARHRTIMLWAARHIASPPFRYAYA